MRQSLYSITLLSSLGVYAKDMYAPGSLMMDDRQYIGTQCAYGSKPYQCQMLSENGCPHGEFVPNYCPGSTNIQCCVEDSAQGSYNSSMHAPGYGEDYGYYYHYTDCEEYQEGEPFDRSKYFYPDDFDPSSPSDRSGPNSKAPPGGGSTYPGSSNSPCQFRGDGRLKVVDHPRLTGYQLVVSDYFAPKVQDVIDCLPDNGAQIHITSAARCGIPSGGATQSMHMLGRAFDFNIKMGDSLCDKDCLGSCWRGERSDQFSWIREFLQCIQSRGLEYGADYTPSDPVHITVAREGDFNSQKAEFSPALQSFCSNSYPGADKVSVSGKTCDCS